MFAIMLDTLRQLTANGHPFGVRCEEFRKALREIHGLSLNADAFAAILYEWAMYENEHGQRVRFHASTSARGRSAAVFTWGQSRPWITASISLAN